MKDPPSSAPAPPPEPDPRVRQLLALNQAAIAITSELELDDLLQRIVDSARAAVGCRYAALGVLGDDGYIARFPTSGLAPTEREQIGAPPRGHGLLGVMLRAGRSLRIADIRQDARRAGFPPHHPPMTSLLGVPIFVQGKLVGDLYLTDKEGGPEFSAEDEWLVQLLATHAATALTNADLYQQVRHERARSQALLRVTQALSRSVQLDEVIGLILDSAVALLDAAGAAVYLLDPASLAEARPGAAAPFVGTRYEVGLLRSFAPALASLLPERTLAGRTILAGSMQIIPDTAEEPEMVFPDLAAGRRMRSLAGVPLRSGDDVLGVLSVYADRRSAFAGEVVELLEAFGAQASTALNNARLYEEAERGRAAAEREQQRLRELEQMKDEFLSTAAHELRTPLTTISMASGLALEQLQLLAGVDGPAATPRLDPRLLDLVRLVVESSERMHALVNDLLDLTRLEQGRATLTLADLDLRTTVRAAVAATRPLFESKEQMLTVQMADAPLRVRGDERRLEQVVINLLSNAQKYAPAGAAVAIRVVPAGNERRIQVQDNGPGVPPEEREAIFSRFYRSPQHRQDRSAGTGLGLPIARAIAEMHQGRLWAEAAPGGGALFTLALPAPT